LASFSGTSSSNPGLFAIPLDFSLYLISYLSGVFMLFSYSFICFVCLLNSHPVGRVGREV
jgi:hypothetical protein